MTNRIARWDGTSWHKLDTGLNSTVRSIVVAGRLVYAGGVFTDAGEMVNADYIASWDGSAWHALGGGLNSTVNAIAVAGSNVWVGGNFTSAGGVTGANHIALWDGNSWHQVGNLNDYVSAIAIAGSRIYAGGAFTDADGKANADHIAYWSTVQLFNPVWFALGSGLNANVNAIAAPGHVMYAGGSFTNAGGIAGADRIATWGQWLSPVYLPLLMR